MRPATVSSGESFPETVDALSGAVPPRARDAEDHPFFGGDGFGTRDDSRMAARSRNRAAGEPESVLVTPFRVDAAIQSSLASEPSRALPVRSQIVYAVAVYDRAVQAVAGMQPRDLLGQRLNLAL